MSDTPTTEPTEQPIEQPPTVDDAGRIRTPMSPAVWEADRPVEPEAPAVPRRSKSKPKDEAA